MRKAPMIASLLMMLLVSGCKEQQSLAAERFRIIVTSDNNLIRLDTQNGEVLALTENGFSTIPVDGATQLAIGRIYVFEDGKKMKYVGNGKFEPAVLTLDEYLKKHSAN